MTHIDAIVLAAGRSLRMGTQKLLLPFAGQTMIGHIVDQVAAGPIRRMLVVVADDDNAVATELAQKKVTIIRNPQHDGDMLSSVRAGLRALGSETEAALIALGDQPSVQPALIERIVKACVASGRGIGVPMYGNRTGHPLLVRSRHFGEILTGCDGLGLRAILKSHADDVEQVSTTDPCVLSDIDWPADYERELAMRLAAEASPIGGEAGG
jgi:molybdenum cofactor cytidylyltransferase